jgi:hypothetical protein
MERLVGVVQALSQARDIPAIQEIVRQAARKLTGADGATFVLRDGDKCYYADEDAVSPLWKGQRFPIRNCISGWVMLNRESVVIEDIFADPRIPHDAYRPTFVKSLAMVPIRSQAPVGAIGNYWATHYRPSAEEVAVLTALADTTSVALENAGLYSELQRKVADLQATNYEMGRFVWAASHDLQEPLRHVITQVEMLERRASAVLDARSRAHIRAAVGAAVRLQQLVDDLLVHAGSGKETAFSEVSLDDLLAEAKQDLGSAILESGGQISAGPLPRVNGDPVMLRRVFQNLLSNALKFRKPGVSPVIAVALAKDGNDWVISIEDNGIGVEAAYRESIFGLFQRIHARDEYPGSGIGLATCKKIVELHGGRIWIDPMPDGGSVFRFTIPVLFQSSVP